MKEGSSQARSPTQCRERWWAARSWAKHLLPLLVVDGAGSRGNIDNGGSGGGGGKGARHDDRGDMLAVCWYRKRMRVIPVYVPSHVGIVMNTWADAIADLYARGEPDMG